MALANPCSGKNLIDIAVIFMKYSYFLESLVWCLLELCTYLRLQTDEECCNSCEEVREAYRKKGWALSSPDAIDQVSPYDILAFNSIVFSNESNTSLTNILWVEGNFIIL